MAEQPETATMTQIELASMNKDQLLALIASMNAQPARRITCKVSDKGGLSVYGLGRFPVTLYRSQWERLLAKDVVDQIIAFITTNASLLAVKA